MLLAERRSKAEQAPVVNHAMGQLPSDRAIERTLPHGWCVVEHDALGLALTESRAETGGHG